MIEIILASSLYIFSSIFIGFRANKSDLNFTHLFLISFFLTPLAGFIVLIKSKKRFYYYVYQYKCPRCNYYFTEEHSNCPQCIDEGYKIPLKRVKKIMT